MSKSIFAMLALASAGAIGLQVAESSGALQAKAAAFPIASGPDAAHPAVIELYQSQGCSSCPPALAVLDEVADRADVLALNFAVTYWDQLGWKDTYADPAYTARQWSYARAQGRGNVQTPQLIVNGRAAVLGSRKGEVEQAIARNARKGGPTLAARGNIISVTASVAPPPATVWFVAYDPRTVQVSIRAGDNGGRTLPHRNIVRQLVSLGNLSGKASNFTVPATSPGLKRAVLVQAGNGGPIVAAARL
jgi:hypothetical protein